MRRKLEVGFEVTHRAGGLGQDLSFATSAFLTIW